MKMIYRFILPLSFALLLIAYLSVRTFDELAVSWFTKDVEARSRLAASAASSSLVPLLRAGQINTIRPILDQIVKDERLSALGLCNQNNELIASSELFSSLTSCREAIELSSTRKVSTRAGREQFHFTAVPIAEENGGSEQLLFAHNMEFAQRRGALATRYLYFLFLVLGIVVSSLTLFLLHLTRKGWVSGVTAVIREKGETTAIPKGFSGELFPVVRELRRLIGELEAERKLYDGGRVVWEPKVIKELLGSRLSGDEILIVSNREPYIHNHVHGKIQAQIPASGLVTALEPIMRACSGTWIAHGSGSADREVVDEQDHVRVPPGEESYRIRRVWLTKEEEQGYYYGFSNEGIWPLCHIAHTRPTFRQKDWECYRAVNQKFADAVVQEAKSPNPVVLVQDYHFAVLPEMVRTALPKATIIMFWHIPWPNAEAFGICPWRTEILRGMLGSTILGFHTRFHQNNFLDTVDKFIECRLDREKFSVSHRGKTTAVRSYPISIEWPPHLMGEVPVATECRASIMKRHSIPANCKIALGVERLDYTKGVLERFSAIERLFELYPEWIGRFVLVQIAAPSRTNIETYAQFGSAVERAVERLNSKFSNSSCPTVIMLKEHHEPAAVYEYMRGADLCLVTSLHDGMNLVAKEFVAARSDEQGVLILSMFAGASQELPEALIVNPYNADQCAEAMNSALIMPQEEQQVRMKSMRDQVREYNVFRWAGRMLLDASQVRDRQRIEQQWTETQQSTGG